MEPSRACIRSAVSTSCVLSKQDKQCRSCSQKHTKPLKLPACRKNKPPAAANSPPKPTSTSANAKTRICSDKRGGLAGFRPRTTRGMLAGFRPRTTRSFCFGKRTQNHGRPGVALRVPLPRSRKVRAAELATLNSPRPHIKFGTRAQPRPQAPWTWRHEMAPLQRPATSGLSVVVGAASHAA